MLSAWQASRSRNATWPPPGHDFGWFEHRFAGEAVVSELRAANKAAGWSSESLIFTAEVGGNAAEYVIRIPPAGGGIFPHYDLGADPDPGAVARARHPPPSPILYEPDREWIGSNSLSCRGLSATPWTPRMRRGVGCTMRADVQRRVRLVSRDSRRASPGPCRRGVLAREARGRRRRRRAEVVAVREMGPTTRFPTS